jgi:hypothetical protein
MKGVEGMVDEYVLVVLGWLVGFCCGLVASLGLYRLAGYVVSWRGRKEG